MQCTMRCSALCNAMCNAMQCARGRKGKGLEHDRGRTRPGSNSTTGSNSRRGVELDPGSNSSAGSNVKLDTGWNSTRRRTRHGVELDARLRTPVFVVGYFCVLCICLALGDFVVGFVRGKCLCRATECACVDFTQLEKNIVCQFARVVKGVDLRSTAGDCARVRTPQLTSLITFEHAQNLIVAGVPAGSLVVPSLFTNEIVFSVLTNTFLGGMPKAKASLLWLFAYRSRSHIATGLGLASRAKKMRVL